MQATIYRPEPLTRTIFGPTEAFKCAFYFFSFKPAPRTAYQGANAIPHAVHAPGTSTFTPTEETLHGQLAAASHVQLQNSNGAKLYKSLSTGPEYPAGISPSQLHIIAGSTLLRNAVAAAGYREDRPGSNSGASHAPNYASQLQTNAMQANLYSTINSMRLQQQHHAPPNAGKSPGAVALAAVQAAAAARSPIDPLRHGAYHAQVMYKNLVPQVPQPAMIARPSVTASPHVVNRYSSQNGIKQSSSPTVMRAQTTPHYVVPHQTVSSPSRLAAGSHGSFHIQAPPVANVIPGSPGPPAQVQQIISTPSPRPSILRKRGEGPGTPVAAKRRLPFMDETPSSPGSSSQSMVPSYNAGPTPPAFQSSSKESVNGTPEESPRKRMRKQQFETDTKPEQIKVAGDLVCSCIISLLQMAINVVQPIAGGSGAWRFGDGSQPSLAKSGVVEKKKRGRPRTNSRPATALPIEMHQSVSVFVDIDSPEEKVKPVAMLDFTRGSAASVPPVHIELPKIKTEVKDASDEANDIKIPSNVQHDTSDEEGVTTRSLSSRKKSKSAAVKTELSAEEQQVEDVAGFLADCLEETKKERHIRQRIKELDPLPSGSKTFFDMVPRQRLTSARASAHPYPKQFWRSPEEDELLVNHFDTVEEFESTYGKYRKLKHLQRREAKFSSSLHIHEAAERCVDYCEKNVRSFCESLGFQPCTPANDLARDDLIALMEKVLKDRLEAEGCMCAGLSLYNSRDISKLPYVSCDESDDEKRLLTASPAAVKNITWGSRNDAKEIEQLVDEMVEFVTRSEGDDKEFLERSFTRDGTGRSVRIERGQKFTNGILSARQSRARILQSDPFTSILKNVKLSCNESQELFDNVFSIGPSCQKKSYWNTVASKKTRRKHVTISNRSVSPSLELQNSDMVSSSCSSKEVESHVLSEESASELDLISLRERLAVRLHHMNLQVSEQIRFEEQLLEIFDRFIESYNPKYHWKMMLDMERDFEEGDSEATVQQKRIERLRYVLMLPPGKLAPEKKPDFGDHCGTVISCPDEVEINRHMMGISPFWKGPMIKDNTKGFYLTRTGRRMHDRDESYTPLNENNKEYYLEDLVDYREPARLRKDYSAMEMMWSKLEHLRLNCCKSVAKKEPDRGSWMSRRKLARLSDEDVVCLGSIQTDVLKAPEYYVAPNGKEETSEFLRRGASTREILATAFKAIRQTTMMMIQTR
ncbi:hypothetical protein OESDEN_05637 [Oesophagostomum dentatum]|uniref:TFIIS central domain-containing protein n=1 Tax=Oesophagostomum dentatum TaxID=61180 RepID=A0A0B1TGA0_OESDE|nr:hypothetical protein OESDEN_05637 [Oesophagostomum dentatum]